MACMAQALACTAAASAKAQVTRQQVPLRVSMQRLPLSPQRWASQREIACDGVLILAQVCFKSPRSRIIALSSSRAFACGSHTDCMRVAISEYEFDNSILSITHVSSALQYRQQGGACSGIRQP